MIEFFGGLVLGGIISWGITHFYYVRSGEDQKVISDKLSFELKDLILSDKRASLSVADLNALLRDKVLNGDSQGKLPYKVCPKCGSENILRSIDYIVDGENGFPYKTIECYDCGWTDDEIRKDVDRIKK